MIKMKNKVKQNNYMPVKDFAILYHLSVQAVYKRISLGKLNVRKIGTYTLVQEP